MMASAGGATLSRIRTSDRDACAWYQLTSVSARARQAASQWSRRTVVVSLLPFS
jgi:hypothetical protein